MDIGPEVPSERDQVLGGEGVLEESGELDPYPGYFTCPLGLGGDRKWVC